MTEDDELSILVRRLRKSGHTEEIINLAVAARFELDQDGQRRTFEARQQHVEALEQANQFAMKSVVDYATQTLKWLFLVNAGAIVALGAYVGVLIGAEVEGARSILKAVFPFGIGCLCVIVSGAAGYWNFITLSLLNPPLSKAYQFLDVSTKTWPEPAGMRDGETVIQCNARINKRLGQSFRTGIVFAFFAGLSFLIGLAMVWALAT